MAQCAKCGNQDMEYKKGTAKTTGKPWQGWKCEPCNLMHGMNGVPWGEKPKAPIGNPQAGLNFSPSNPIGNLENKVDEILAILKANFKQVTIEKDEDSTPF